MIDIKMNYEGYESNDSNKSMRIDLHTSYLIKTNDTIYDIFVYPLTYIHNFIKKPSDNKIMKAAIEIITAVDYFTKINNNESSANTTNNESSSNIEDCILTCISIYNELRENVNVAIILGYLFHVYMAIISLMDKYCKEAIQYTDTDSNTIKYIFNNGMECIVHLDSKEIEIGPIVDEGEDEIH